MPNENEDPLKRTMALIDEHKDKFSDGLYLEIATNMHKAWSDRARNLRFDETAANRETTRGDKYRGSRTAAIYLRNSASTDDPGATASYRCFSSPLPKN